MLQGDHSGTQAHAGLRRLLLYTQLTDMFQKVSGLLGMDNTTSHVREKRKIYRINQQKR